MLRSRLAVPRASGILKLVEHPDGRCSQSCAECDCHDRGEKVRQATPTKLLNPREVAIDHSTPGPEVCTGPFYGEWNLFGVKKPYKFAVVPAAM